MTRTIRVTCARLRALISSYLDDDLSDTQCAAIEAHAATCKKCERVIAELRLTAGLCRSAASVPLPASVRERARQRMRELLKRSRRASKQSPQ